MPHAQPLLSICIPTFNRAHLLRSALWSLVPQIKPYGDLVEVIVSDNGSSDDTQAVIRWAQQYIPIHNHRNDKDIGVLANFFLLTNTLANGEFCWILGDDDLVRGNAVKSVLEVIQAYPTLDYIFVNHSYERVSERDKHGDLVTGNDFPELRHLLCWKTSEQLVARWEEIIRFSNVPALFTSIVSHVFRRSKWKDESLALSTDTRQLFRSLETTFPNVWIVARMMVGKPAYYLGYPHVILFTGTQEWFSRWPEILFTRVLEISDLFQSLGVDRSLVDLYRNTLFRGSSEQLRLLFTQSITTSLPVVWRLVSRYGQYPALWLMFLRAIGRAIIKRRPHNLL